MQTFSLTKNEGYSGYGGPAVSRIQGMPGINKGGQMTMLYDTNQHHPRDYIHHHFLVKKDPQFTNQGPNEVFPLTQQVIALVHINVEESPFNHDETHQIFQCLTAGNHFCGNSITKHWRREIWIPLHNNTRLVAICH